MDPFWMKYWHWSDPSFDAADTTTRTTSIYYIVLSSSVSILTEFSNLSFDGMFKLTSNNQILYNFD